MYVPEVRANSDARRVQIEARDPEPAGTELPAKP